jgi:hypothetical protein
MSFRKCLSSIFLKKMKIKNKKSWSWRHEARRKLEKCNVNHESPWRRVCVVQIKGFFGKDMY